MKWRYVETKVAGRDVYELCSGEPDDLGRRYKVKVLALDRYEKDTDDGVTIMNRMVDADPAAKEIVHRIADFLNGDAE